MNIVELKRVMEECKREGRVVFFCHATSGTTVMGSFDDIDAIVGVSNELRKNNASFVMFLLN
jgi:glutamate/tyrosine decarboxylase-like PLP-dependent enzyme